MHKLIEKIKSVQNDVTFDTLGEFIKSINIDSIDYDSFVNEPESIGDYGRHKFTDDSFECVLINWPAGVESAVHHHKGLFGYVWVLEGELDNVSYTFENNKLLEYAIDRYGRDGLCPEPDGIIHKLRNNSKTKKAITLHFYYPAIKSFEGMRIFNLKNGEVGILSAEAKTAKWSLKEGHFKKVIQNAFEFVPLKN
jgi:predicted metal-dependent enzyme (double-stranded beta helix superfamily)